MELGFQMSWSDDREVIWVSLTCEPFKIRVSLAGHREEDRQTCCSWHGQKHVFMAWPTWRANHEARSGRQPPGWRHCQLENGTAILELEGNTSCDSQWTWRWGTKLQVRTPGQTLISARWDLEQKIWPQCAQTLTYKNAREEHLYCFKQRLWSFVRQQEETRTHRLFTGFRDQMVQRDYCGLEEGFRQQISDREINQMAE